MLAALQHSVKLDLGLIVLRLHADELLLDTFLLLSGGIVLFLLRQVESCSYVTVLLLILKLVLLLQEVVLEQNSVLVSLGLKTLDTRQFLRLLQTQHVGLLVQEEKSV